jgi:glycosyltransferase involved in cell wall biosynthesis
LALDAYQAVHEENLARRRETSSILVRLPRRPRLAWLADWPLSEGRVEDLQGLAQIYDIDLHLDHEMADQRVVAVGLPVIDIGTFMERAAIYDRVVVERADAANWLAVRPAVLVRRGSHNPVADAPVASAAVLGIIRESGTAGDVPAGPVGLSDAPSPMRWSSIAHEIERGHCAASSPLALARQLARLVPAGVGDDYDWCLAEAIAANQPVLGPPRLLVDVSNVVYGNPGSGISRVVRRILQSLIDAPPVGLTVEPVRALATGAPFLHAHGFAAELRGQVGTDPPEHVVELRPGDQFLALDLNYGLPAQAFFIARLREVGGQAHALIHDLLPMQRPDWFPKGLDQAHRKWFDEIARWDTLLCTTQEVAQEVRKELDLRGLNTGWPRLRWFHLGSDLPIMSSTVPLPELAGRPSVLMVSMLRARKGHAQALDAIEQLWASGVDVNFVLVGRQGWGVDKFVKRLRAHGELNRRLFWYDGIDDAMLGRLYAVVDGVLVASEAEGFGLPLVEALRHRRPVLAPDLPVFREIAGDDVTYFRGLDVQTLAQALHVWLDQLPAGRARRPGKRELLSWSKAAQQMLAAMGLRSSASPIPDESATIDPAVS